jgi:regulator of sirC expression with transglutaminase-like and TPR domain
VSWRLAAPLAAVLALLACPRPRTTPARLTPGFLELADLARREVPVPLPLASKTRRRFDELVERARAVVGPKKDRSSVDRLVRLLFVELGYKREIDDRTVMPSLLPWVLQQRRGSCVGLGTLFLALGEELGLPLEGVLVPGHFFVRYRGPDGTRSVELLKEGHEMAEGWYRERYPLPRDNPMYLRGLRPDETLAVLRYNVANALRERGRLARAVEEYRRVAAVLPDFAEAQANLGLACHKLRDFTGAEQAYRKAGRANPGLPGLHHNFQQLYREWHRRD